jgi:adenosylmethionine-8-amino-7-oxononanoate aminotransferase
VIRKVEDKARVLRDAIAPLAAHRHVGDIRQAGLMCGVELVADRSTKALFPPGDRVGYHLCLSLRDRGIFLRPLGDVIALMPPLSSTDEELQHLAASLHAAIVERLGA